MLKYKIEKRKSIKKKNSKQKKYSNKKNKDQIWYKKQINDTFIFLQASAILKKMKEKRGKWKGKYWNPMVSPPSTCGRRLWRPRHAV